MSARTITVTLDGDALDALDRIKRRRAEWGSLSGKSNAEREDNRSDAVDVVNALLRANPELRAPHAAYQTNFIATQPAEVVAESAELRDLLSEES